MRRQDITNGEIGTPTSVAQLLLRWLISAARRTRLRVEPLKDRLEVNPDDILTKPPVKRLELLRQGELGRMILGLGNSDGELPTAAIVDAVLAVGGHGEVPGVRWLAAQGGNLAYLERRGVVAKCGSGSEARRGLC